MKKILSLLIVLAVVLSSVCVFASDIRTSSNVKVETIPVPTDTTEKTTTETKNEAPKVSFSDVDGNSASGKAIYKLVNAGILNGYTDGTFRPNNPLTRAELCKIVNLVFKYTEAEELNFSDVKKEDWFYNYVAIAKKAGYIAGHDDGTFKGNDYLTREQTCTIITRVTSLYDISMTETITDTVSPWAIPYVNKVVANRIMPLEAGGKFRATENITRAELVSVMSNFVVEEEKPSGNTTATQYTVTFNTNGGNTIDSVKVESGKTVTKPANPTKKGYNFAGWYTDSGLKNTFDFNSKITANITLYAKWTAVPAGGGGGGGSSGGGSSDGNTTKYYTVTFNTNGGSTVSSQSVKKGSSVSKPAEPTKDGYKFLGWYKDSGLSSQYDFSTSISKDTTIYAKWVKVYTVTFDTGEGPSVDPVVVETGKAVKEPDHGEWQGYYFIGWYKDSDFISLYKFSSKVTSDITLYAKWIVYDADKQKETVDTINIILGKVTTESFLFNLSDKQLDIIEIATDVMNLVIKDANNGKLIYDGDYILDNYGDSIGPATNIYHNEMSDSEQESFYSYLITELGEDDADRLLQIMFGISLEDAKDKIEN